MKNPHDVILRPVLTEASYEGIADKRYVFEVHKSANKTEIKLALEAIFKDIKVEKVNTLRTIGKIKRQGRTSGRTPEIKKAYKQIEAVSCEKLLALLPPEVQESYRPLLFESDSDIARIVKAADKLSAYIKCVEELKAGNSEFAAAEKQTRQALVDMQLPCLDYFMAHFLDSFRLTLDELE